MTGANESPGPDPRPPETGVGALPAPPLLRADDLSVEVTRRPSAPPVRVVEGVTLTVTESETLALVGESGCGKTTTALGILRLLPTSMRLHGSVWLADRELTRMTEGEMQRVRGKELAMVFQDPAAALNPCYTVGEQIAEGLRYHERLTQRAAWEQAVSLLAEVGLPDAVSWARAYPHQMSGGMRQRALFATAIACRPRVLIADEPTAALDLTRRGQVVALLNGLRVARRLALLLISHDLTAVAGLADRVAVMYAGQIVEQTDVHTFFAGPKHPYSQALLAATARLADCAEVVDRPSARPSTSEGCRYAATCPQVAAECQTPQQLLVLRPGHAVRCWRAAEARE